MDTVLEPLNRAFTFLKRYPNLDGSKLLEKEARGLIKALIKYNDKAETVHLSLIPDYAETAGLLEAEGKSLVTPDFVAEFTRKHCSRILSFDRINKKERTTLLLLAAKDGKLKDLKKQLDPTRKYREVFQNLLSEPAEVIRKKVVSMKSGDFQGMVKAVGLDAPRTRAGSISASKGAKENVIKQMLRDKKSDELMERLGNE
ncbi:MAG TPA: hypothetical protein VMC85_07780 [Desulfomonilaceae bacterium]|nr:hypothetical protein [Desulfomonilaceae bacterium]